MDITENEQHIDLTTLDKLILDCVNDRDGMKSTRIGLFEEMIKTGIIKVDDALPILVKEMKTVSDMGIVSICLRNNVNRNLYVEAESLGPAHIIVYAYHTLNRQLFDMFYIIMVMSGSDVTLPCYKKIVEENPFLFYKKANDRRVTFEEDSLIKTDTVYEWLKQKKDFNLPLLKTDLLTLVKKKSDRSVYGVYLDTNQFCEWTPDDIDYMLFSRNSKWQNIMFETDDKSEDKLTQDSIYLKIAISATFYDLVLAQMNSGLRPTYIDFSFWIYHYKTIKQINNVDYLVDQLEKSFIELIKRGFKIDLYYLDEIGSINPELRVTLFEEYQKPLFEKVCSVTQDEHIPNDIKNVSVYLGIPESADKSSFCSSVESITQANHDSLIKANRKRSTDAISSKLNLLSDFINHSHFEGCINISSFEENPLNYPVDLLAYYKDNEGQTWCFLSNDFESLLRNKVNPSTKTKLPDDFLNRLEQQRNILKYFGIPLSDPKTINRIIADIKKSETPSNKESDEIISNVQLVLTSKGYTESFITKNMKLRDIVTKFDRVGVAINEILIISESEYDKTIEKARTEFSPRIMYNLICFCLNDVLKTNIEQLQKFLK